MDAGRELNIRIALEVFKGERYMPDQNYDDSYFYKPDGPDSFVLTETRPWSTSWDAMQYVVEAMQERGYSFTCSGPIDFDGPEEGWQARFYIEWTRCWTAHAYLLPHAVCEAALKAVSDE